MYHLSRTSFQTPCLRNTLPTSKVTKHLVEKWKLLKVIVFVKENEFNFVLNDCYLKSYYKLILAWTRYIVA